MKLLTLAMLAAFGASALVGCEASGRVGDTDHVDTDTSHSTTYKKTTVERPTGETTVKTETRHDNY